MTTQKPLDLAGMAQDVHNMGFLDYGQALILIREVERLRGVVAATHLSEASILAGVVPLMRDVCMSVLDAHKTSRGLDTLDERISAQEDNLVRIASLLGKE